jgi:hypothetical protein
MTVVSRDAKQREARHQHAGRCARLERNIEGHRRDPCVEASRGAHVGAHRHMHANEARRTRQDRADDEADRHRMPGLQGDEARTATPTAT